MKIEKYLNEAKGKKKIPKPLVLTPQIMARVKNLLEGFCAEYPWDIQSVSDLEDVLEDGFDYAQSRNDWRSATLERETKD